MGDKEKLDRYREAAARRYAQEGLRISPHGNVQPTEGGAFVEAMLWVDERDVTPQGKE